MFSIIVAFDKNRLIGKNNKMPWNFKEDLKYFKETTLNHKVVMGRKTFDSILNYINKPLPGRENIVLSRRHVDTSDVKTFNNIEQLIKAYKESKEEIFIIGGKTIYEQLLPHTSRLYITHIDDEYDGDVYFPSIDYTKWTLVEERKSGVLRFCIYERMI